MMVLVRNIDIPACVADGGKDELDAGKIMIPYDSESKIFSMRPRNIAGILCK
jgi:hypothetical protein